MSEYDSVGLFGQLLADVDPATAANVHLLFEVWSPGWTELKLRYEGDDGMPVTHVVMRRDPSEVPANPPTWRDLWSSRMVDGRIVPTTEAIP